MQRLASLASAAVLALAALTGCGGGSTEEFCQLNEQAEQLDIDAESQEVQDSLDELAGAAPDEIKDDVETIREAVDNPGDADQQQVQEASDNIESFIEENC